MVSFYPVPKTFCIPQIFYTVLRNTNTMKTQHTNFQKHTFPKHLPGLDYHSKLILFFFLASAGGFLWEILIYLIKDGEFHNRGFLYGPWLPIYGCGAVLMYLLLGRIKNHPIAVFLLSVLIGSTIELVIGWLLDVVWNLRYWDYHSYPLNFYGYICLFSALGFGIAGALWICVLCNKIEHLWFLLSAPLRYKICTLLILIFIVDCAAALIFPNTGIGVTFP